MHFALFVWYYPNPTISFPHSPLCPENHIFTFFRWSREVWEETWRPWVIPYLIYATNISVEKNLSCGEISQLIPRFYSQSDWKHLGGDGSPLSLQGWWTCGCKVPLNSAWTSRQEQKVGAQKVPQSIRSTSWAYPYHKTALFSQFWWTHVSMKTSLFSSPGGKSRWRRSLFTRTTQQPPAAKQMTSLCFVWVIYIYLFLGLMMLLI